MTKHLRALIVLSVLLFAAGLLLAQSASQAKPADSTSSVESQPAQPSEHSAAPEAKPVENEDEMEENAEFKYGWGVQLISAKTGLSKETSYWLFVIINFGILATGVVWVVKKVLPQGFAPRTAEIQKGMEEARKASNEATARLQEVENKLSRLASEIDELRKAAEADFSVEEGRIKLAAEQDARNVIAAAEQEIAAAARSAQRELKAFVADLSVSLAEKKIHVDDSTDSKLIGNFASQLGKDGR